MHVEDWIYCETTTTGTGALTLTTKAGWLSFTAYFAIGADGDGDLFEYLIRDATTKLPIEAGIGRMSDATTMQRVHVYKTLVGGVLSQANAPANLASGTKEVVCADLASSRLRGNVGLRAAAPDNLIGDAQCHTGTGNTKTIAVNQIYGIPFRVTHAGLISGAGAYVTTAASGSNIRIGLYRLNLAREPKSLIVATGDIPTTATGKVTASWSSGGDRRIPAGDYVLAVKSNGGAPQLFAGEANARALPQDHWLGGSGFGATHRLTFGSAADAGASMPATCPALSWTGAMVNFAPRLFLVAAAL